MTKTLVPVLLAAALALAACGSSDEGDEGDVAAGSSSTSSPSASPTTAASPSGSPSEETTAQPSVTPATGRTVTTFSMTFMAPRDFKGAGEVGNGLVSSVQLQSTKCLCQIFAGGLGNLNSEDLEGAASNVFDDTRGVRQPDREIAGRPALSYVNEDKTSRTYTFASIAGDQIATFAMVFTTLEGLAPQGQTPESEQALLDSILATVQWKE